MTTRREFLRRSAISAAGLSLPRWRFSSAQTPPHGFLDLRRPPDAIRVQTATGEEWLRPVAGGRWEAGDLAVTVSGIPGALRVALAAPSSAVQRLQLRWRGRLDDTRLLLGDAWERGYGDLEWRGFVPDRVMPWYVAAWDGQRTHLYGVRTGASAFCFWHVDPQGISLWADVRSGGVGVQLGPRVLSVCEVVCRAGRAGESAFQAIHAFCKEMCPSPRLPAQPVYGSNDWYWVYGKNTAATVRVDAQHIVELSPADANRPFAVIDDGWQPDRGADGAGVGTWDHGNEKFPDMPGLAGEIRRAGARPGIWIRPLPAPAAGDALIIGCNTVSHLSAGRFEIRRIGDDTSGREWARTRKMGVNTLAFRGAQHGAFYTADADCVGVTNAIPWEENRRWLDLLARSGTMLFVSLAPDALGAEQRRDLRAALATAARPQPLGEPLDWQRTAWPTRWRLLGQVQTYDWLGADRAAPRRES